MQVIENIEEKWVFRSIVAALIGLVFMWIGVFFGNDHIFGMGFLCSGLSVAIGGMAFISMMGDE